MNVIDSFRLDGKIAVVTGGGGLYGTGFCRALAEAGATVVLTSRSLATADSAVAALRADGLDVRGFELDQSEPDSIDAFAARVSQTWGSVDVLVNNAVHRQGGDLAHTTAEDWDATAAVNARGLFLLTQTMVEQMIAAGRGGSIVNIGSIYGIVGPDFPVYDGTLATSPIFYSYDKGGMIGMTRYLASALGPHRIRVNCLCPGGLRSEGQDPTFVEQYVSRTPLGRMADHDDVPPALVFLASPASAYVTGTVLPVDGGWTAR